jgi:deoxyribodipyrimidine photo-lyase
MKPQTHIIWFKRDLRVQDHLPLVQAAILGNVLPLYIVEPEMWQRPDSSRRHWHFIHDSLLDLQQALTSLGAPLVVRIGQTLQILDQLYHQIGHFTLWSHEETGNGWTYQRDKNVAHWCRARGVKWHEIPNNGVVRRLKSRDNWAGIRNNRMAVPVLEHPPSLTAARGLEPGYLPHKSDPLFGTDIIGSVQTGGRNEAQRTLESFLRERSRRYMQSISKPGISARHCSRLSAHLAFGTLSVREVEHATKAKIQMLQESNDPEAIFHRRNLSAFLSRLAWRCHFVQKLEQRPDIEYHCMHSAFENMREPHFRDDFFQAWQSGHTGYPLVDACMRSLHENGWITFRMRAMLVSFASYHLWLDWRKTAPFLARLFTDYEPGIHYSQFQMQSGVTGINAIRMYNPVKQSMDQDPQGKFLRRYLPELRDVPDSFLHQPWRMGTSPKGYPVPIIVHEDAIRHARAEISKRWKEVGFSEESRAVNRQLGSRSKPPTRRKQQKKTTTSQLSLDL